MSSPELWESSARMLEVTEGRWSRNVPIPRAIGEDMFTSRLACEMKFFPYGRNVTAEAAAGGAVLSMDICVDDYRVGGVMMFDAHTGRGLVGECLFIYFFHGVWVLDKIVMQGRMLGNWLLSWLR
jgi:hypothetical protein